MIYETRRATQDDKAAYRTCGCPRSTYHAGLAVHLELHQKPDPLAQLSIGTELMLLKTRNN